MKTLTVTAAAKNFTEYVERVYREHETFELVSNGVPCARLVPANGLGCSTHDLADDLDGAELGAKDRHDLGLAIRKGRQQLKPLKNPWA